MEYQILSNYDIKSQARKAMKGRVFTIIGMLLLIVIVQSLLGQLVSVFFPEVSAQMTAFAQYQTIPTINGSFVMYYILTILVSIVVMPASIGVMKYALLINRGKVEAPFDVMLSPYKGFKHIFTIFFAQILVMIITYIGIILFIIPGLILFLSYALVPYILAEEPELKAIQVLKKSRAMMKGYKGKLFGLYLSLIGWLVLVIITFGIAAIWVIPYVYTLSGKFYDEVLKVHTPPAPDEAVFADSEKQYDTEAEPEVFTDI